MVSAECLKRKVQFALWSLAPISSIFSASCSLGAVAEPALYRNICLYPPSAVHPSPQAGDSSGDRSVAPTWESPRPPSSRPAPRSSGDLCPPTLVGGVRWERPPHSRWRRLRVRDSTRAAGPGPGAVPRSLLSEDGSFPAPSEGRGGLVLSHPRQFQEAEAGLSWSLPPGLAC